MDRSFVSCLLLFALSAGSAPCAEPEAKATGRRYPTYVSGYELATHEDMLYRHLLDQMIIGDMPGQWPVLSGVAGQVGDWINVYLTADRIANIITVGMSVEGQPPLNELNALITDCAKILQLPKPECFIRNSPETKAYATQVDGRPVLVLTSGIVKLYHGKPEELRFIVGRELGHIKCDHVRMHTAATGILEAMRQIDLAAIPADYQSVLPTFALGQLCSWARESEISADRAGLLCCQDPEVAYQALLRLLHGLDDSTLGSDVPDFCAVKAMAEFQRWQNRPFVEFLSELKRSDSHAPFILERVAALKFWADLGHWQLILARQHVPANKQLMVIKQIDLHGVASSDSPANPYLVAHDGAKKLFSTQAASSVTSVRWKNIDVVHACDDWRPIFFEIWNDTYGSDELIGGFVLYPESGSSTYTARLIWDWKDAAKVSRVGMAKVRVEFRDKGQ